MRARQRQAAGRIAPALFRIRLPGVLLAVFTVAWISLAIDPWYPQDWWLENALVLIAVPFILWRHRKRPFSEGACLCLFAFGILHIVGAHYTYSEVPYAQWWNSITGSPLPGARNHYDRLVHLAYGVLLALPAIELLDDACSPRRAWKWLLPVLFLMSHSTIYETIEWVAAEVFGGDLGQAYLGTQGDEWDSHKDMALASLGAMLAVTAILAWRFTRPGARPRPNPA